MPELRLCTSTMISVALKPFNYEVHGHDVIVEACWCSGVDRRVDLEVLARRLEEVSRYFDRRPLWELLGHEGAMVEDLILEISRRLEEVEGLRLCTITARWFGRSITISF